MAESRKKYSYLISAAERNEGRDEVSPNKTTSGWLTTDIYSIQHLLFHISVLNL